MIRFVAAVAAISATKTFQRDRPCTQAVYPQHLRDSSLVQTAFAPSPASKNRSASYSNRMVAGEEKSGSELVDEIDHSAIAAVQESDKLAEIWRGHVVIHGVEVA